MESLRRVGEVKVVCDDPLNNFADHLLFRPSKLEHLPTLLLNFELNTVTVGNPVMMRSY